MGCSSGIAAETLLESLDTPGNAPTLIGILAVVLVKPLWDMQVKALKMLQRVLSHRLLDSLPGHAAGEPRFKAETPQGFLNVLPDRPLSQLLDR